MNECATGEQPPVTKPIFDSLSPKNVALFFFLTICFFATARLGLWLHFVQPYATPVWLPGGCAIAVFILFGYRSWPAVLIGSFLGHVTALGPVRASFVAPVAVVLEGIAAAYLVNRFAHGVKAFDTVRDVIRFVLFTCILAPLIDAVLAFNTNFLVWHHSFADASLITFQWWLAHSIGVLVVAPFFVLLFRASHHPLHLPEVVELSTLLAGLIFLCLLVFGPLSANLNPFQVIRPYMGIPFLLWAAFRFCPLEAAGATFILFGSAIWGTMHGYGQFVSHNHAESLTLMDAFIGVTGIMTLVVAALVVQRRQIELKLLAVQSLLQEAVEGKNRDLELTAQALELEVAGHTRTKKILRDNQERLRLLAENHGKPQEVQIQRETVE
jgi:integral membrane sensor domain MASE1